MFKLFGHSMYLVPAETQLFNQEYFPQAMLPYDHDRRFITKGSKYYTLVFLIGYETLVCYTLYHIGNGRRPAFYQIRNSACSNSGTGFG
jgi:hypothetical protein